MISLRLVRLIESHSDELADELVAKLDTSSRTGDLRKVPVEELRRRFQEVLRHLSEWLLTKTGPDIQQRYFEIGERRASQGVALSDFCWAIAVTKEHLWEFLQRQGSMRGPVEIYGEMDCCACWTTFSIALCALRPRATSSTSGCTTRLKAAPAKRGLRLRVRPADAHSSPLLACVGSFRSSSLAGLRLALRLGLALEIERHGSTNEVLQGRLIDLVAVVDVDGAPDIPFEAGVE